MSEVTASPTTTTTTADPRAARRAARYAGYVFWLMALIAFFNYVDRWLFLGLANTIQLDLHLSDFEIGLLGSSAFLIVYTIFALPLGFLADRVSRKLIVSAGVAVWSLATVFTGVASGFLTLAGVRGLLGIGEASYFPAGTPLLAAHYRPGHRARVFARWGVAGLLGTAVGFLLATVFSPGLLPSITLDSWRYAFIFAGVPGLVLAILMFFTREKRRHEDDPPVNKLEVDSRSFITRVRAYLRIPTVRVILALHALGFFGLTGVTTFLSIYLYRSYGAGEGAPYPAHVGLSYAEVAILAGGVIVIGGVAGQLYGGRWADRMSRRHTGARVLVGGLGFLLSAPCVAIATGMPYILSLLPAYNNATPSGQVTMGVACFLPFALLAAFFLNIYSGPVGAALLDVVPPEDRGSAGGAELTLAHLLGDVYAAAAIGALSGVLGGAFGNDQVGLGVALLATVPVALLLSGIVGIWGSRFYAADIAKLGTTAEAMLGTAAAR